MEPTDEHWRLFREHLKRQEEDIKEREKAGQNEAQEEFQRFLAHADRGECYVCGKGVKTFSKSSPCPHWLLRPKGVKKPQILEVLTRNGYHRSAAFLRWFANYEALNRNINDLSDEGDPNALFHWSCRYESRKWTFKCVPADHAGHTGTKHDYPHFHFEMRLAGQIFVKFNEFHVPFTDEDLFWLRANADDEFPVKQSFGPHGSGMQDAMNVDPEALIDHLQRGEEGEEDEAVFQIDSFVFREEGIPGEMVERAINASNESGKTIAYHLRELGLEPNIIVSPATTIPDKAERNNPRKKKAQVQE